jgi:hypothetical protein
MGINSKYSHINNHTQLMRTIMQVNASRVQQEEDVKHKLKEIYYSLQPAELLRNALGSEGNEPIKKNFAQSALSIGKNFLINKVFNRGNSVKGFLVSTALGKVADYAIGGKAKLIIKGVSALGGLIKKFKS